MTISSNRGSTSSSNNSNKSRTSSRCSSSISTRKREDKGERERGREEKGETKQHQSSTRKREERGIRQTIYSHFGLKVLVSLHSAAVGPHPSKLPARRMEKDEKPGGPASSSGGDPAKEQQAAEAEPLSHAGRLFLDVGVDGNWYLTDVMTQEQKQLSKDDAPWEMAIHPETGRAVVFSKVHDDEIVVVDEFMTKQIYVHPESKELIIVEPRPGGMVKEMPLDILQVKFRECKLNAKVGYLDAKMEMRMYMFVRSRACGLKCFIDCNCLYSIRKLTQYKGQCSKWFYNMEASWQRRNKDHMGDGHVIYGTDCEKDNLSFKERCLPGSCT